MLTILPIVCHVCCRGTSATGDSGSNSGQVAPSSQGAPAHGPRPSGAAETRPSGARSRGIVGPFLLVAARVVALALVILAGFSSAHSEETMTAYKFNKELCLSENKKERQTCDFVLSGIAMGFIARDGLLRPRAACNLSAGQCHSRAIR
jgi:hypothetical protein